MPPSSGKSTINVQARTGPTPGMDVSSRYRCASAASVATISTRRLSSSSMSAASKTPQQRVFQQSRGILSGDFLGTELAANSKHLGHQFGCRRRPLRWTCRHDADERCDHSGIERIVLRQNPARPRKLSKFERIDLAHGQAAREQRTHDATLVTTTRL